MTWNKKNQQFALSCGLRPSTKELAQCCLRKTDNYKPTKKLIDLKEINRQLAKHRGQPYDPKTMKEAIAQLDQDTHGWFKIVKSHNWHLHQVIICPLEMVLQKLSKKSESSPKLKTGNPMFSSDHKKTSREQQQQNISKLDTLFRKVGLTYGRDALARIWRLADKNIEEVLGSIELLLHRHSFGKTKIANAHGFIIDCLKGGWYYESELFQPADLPVFDGISALVDAVNRLRGGELSGIGGYKT